MEFSQYFRALHALLVFLTALIAFSNLNCENVSVNKSTLTEKSNLSEKFSEPDMVRVGTRSFGEYHS